MGSAKRRHCVQLLHLLVPVVAAQGLRWGEPVQLGRGRYFAPALSALPNPATGRVDALFATEDRGILRSQDGGASWQMTGYNGTFPTGQRDAAVDRITARAPYHNFGDVEARYQGHKAPFVDFWGAGDVTQFEVSDADGSFRATSMAGANVTFTGAPRAMGCIATACCNCPFRTDSGQVARLPDGSQVMTMNAFFDPAPGRSVHGDGSSVVAYRSNDADGLSWRYLAPVALAEDWDGWSGEGPNESALSLLADGSTLLAVVRLDAGDGGAGGKPYGKSFSTDGGASWSPLANMTAPTGGTLIGTAKPQLALVGSQLVLIGGRPGNKVWVNADGTGGDAWDEYALPAPAQQASTCYNGIVAVNTTNGIATFDSSGMYYAVPFTLTSDC